MPNKNSSKNTDNYTDNTYKNIEENIENVSISNYTEIVLMPGEITNVSVKGARQHNLKNDQL